MTPEMAMNGIKTIQFLPTSPRTLFEASNKKRITPKLKIKENFIFNLQSKENFFQSLNTLLKHVAITDTEYININIPQKHPNSLMLK